MTPKEVLTERTDRNKDLRLGRFSLKAAVGANLSLAATYLLAAEVYRQGLRDVLAVGAFFLFVGLALAALVAGAASWRTQVGRLGLLIVLSTLPFATVAVLQQRYLDVYQQTGHSLYRRPVRYVDRARTVYVPTAPAVVDTPVAPAPSPDPAPVRSSPAPTVYFSPGGGCTQAIVSEIAAARQTIRVQAYSFTSAPIAAALSDAHKRGVDVIVLLDKSQQTAKYSSATFLHNAGINTLIDENHAIAHNKIILVDGVTVVTGSFNFSKAAEENNAENLLILRDANLAARYGENWQTHAQHARAYVPPIGAAR